MNDSEGINQRTFTHKLWTGATIWGLTWEGMLGLGGQGEREKKLEQL